MPKVTTGAILSTYNRHFLIGVLCGYLLAMAETSIRSTDCKTAPVNASLIRPSSETTDRESSIQLTPTLSNQPDPRSNVTHPTSSEDNPVKKDRILCWVVTSPGTKSRAEMVKKTWGQRCDKLLFISSKNDSTLPAVGMTIRGPESRLQLWNKAKATFHYVYDNYLNDYDWFYKADDDTYTVMENLRYLLSNFNSSQPLFLGRQLRYQAYTFLSGGSGYAMTRESLRRLVEIGLKNQMCPEHYEGKIDDVIVSICLQAVGVTLEDTRDLLGHQRFIPFGVEEFFSGRGNNISFLQENDVYPLKLGYDCCSNVAISFHYVSDYRMQLYEYLIYKLQVVSSDNSPLRRLFNSLLLI